MNTLDSSKTELIKNFGQPDIPRDQILLDVQSFVKKFPFKNENQLNLTSTEEKARHPYAGIGSFFNKSSGQFTDNEKSYKFIHPRLRGTALEALIEKMKTLTKFKMGRTRLMRLPPKRCYSLHHDSGPRLHYVISTNPQCYMAFEGTGRRPDGIYLNAQPEIDIKYFHLPADGCIYGLDTRYYHSAMNGGEEDRIHLVMSLTNP